MTKLITIFVNIDNEEITTCVNNQPYLYESKLRYDIDFIKARLLMFDYEIFWESESLVVFEKVFN